MPEYNHSTSGVKNAIDYLYAEWNDKAMGVVSYGAVAGATARRAPGAGTRDAYGPGRRVEQRPGPAPRSAAGCLARAKEKQMANYRIVYGDDEQVVRETFNDVELQREDGWLVIFRGKDAILRAREEHIQSVETLDDMA
jgi:hypothetical protein